MQDDVESGSVRFAGPPTPLAIVGLTGSLALAVPVTEGIRVLRISKKSQQPQN